MTGFLTFLTVWPKHHSFLSEMSDFLTNLIARVRYKPFSLSLLSAGACLLRARVSRFVRKPHPDPAGVGGSGKGGGVTNPAPAPRQSSLDQFNVGRQPASAIGAVIDLLQSFDQGGEE